MTPVPSSLASLEAIRQLVETWRAKLYAPATLKLAPEVLLYQCANEVAALLAGAEPQPQQVQEKEDMSRVDVQSQVRSVGTTAKSSSGDAPTSGEPERLVSAWRRVSTDEIGLHVSSVGLRRQILATESLILSRKDALRIARDIYELLAPELDALPLSSAPPPPTPIDLRAALQAEKVVSQEHFDYWQEAREALQVAERQRDALIARAESSAPHAPEGKEEIAWLVELGGSRPSWWTGRNDDWTWHVDGTPSTRGNGADSAIRFARREDAERAIGWLLNQDLARGCKATEHLWMPTHPSSAGAVHAPPEGLEKRISLSLRLGKILGPDYDGVSLEDIARELVELKERAALSAPQSWQPIETAPKDGTMVLLREEDDSIFVFHYVDFGSVVPDGYHSGWYDSVGGYYEPTKPTHWMPLPSSPLAPPDPQEAQK